MTDSNNNNGVGGKYVKTSESESATTNIKILVPNNVSGGIIGKSGENVTKLQNETGCEINISKGYEFFPTTEERVVVINGTVKGILTAIEYMNDKMSDRRIDVRDQFDYKHYERSKEVKMVIPDSSAGGVIGKKGDFVKLIEESCDCHVNMSTKDICREWNTNERVVTIVAANMQNLLNGTEMVISKVATDPVVNSSSYTKLTYGQRHGQLDRSYSSRGRSRSPIDRFPPAFSRDNSATRGHYMPPPIAAAPFNHRYGSSSAGFDYNSSSDFSASNGASAPFASVSNFQLLQLLEGLRSTLRAKGYDQMAEAEIMQSIQVLAKFNVLGYTMGLGSSLQNTAPQQAQSIQNSYGGGDYDPAAYLPAVDSSPKFRSFDRSSGPNPGYMSRNDMEKSDESVLSKFSHANAVIKEVRNTDRNYEMYVPDVTIGSIVGKQGRTINEIQRYTDTRIDIEKKKDEFGSKERMISIEGKPEGVFKARYEIMSCIDEEMRRMQRNKN